MVPRRSLLPGHRAIASRHRRRELRATLLLHHHLRRDHPQQNHRHVTRPVDGERDHVRPPIRPRSLLRLLHAPVLRPRTISSHRQHLICLSADLAHVMLLCAGGLANPTRQNPAQFQAADHVQLGLRPDDRKPMQFRAVSRVLDAVRGGAGGGHDAHHHQRRVL